MSKRSFESPLDASLFSSAVGDVLAAHATACRLIAAGSRREDDTLVILILTAALIVAVTQTGGAVRRGDVLRVLVQLRDAFDPGCDFTRSSSQFVRYAAAEIRRAPHDAVERILHQLIGDLCSEGAARDGGAGLRRSENSAEPER